MPLNLSRGALPRHRAAGYALLEALIAVIVTAIGFIGAARLQTVGASFSSGAGMRQRATLLVNQMTDRMRANRVGMDAKYYNNPTAGSTACLTAIAGCAPDALASADMQEWLNDVGAQLPGGVGVVCIDSDVTSAADLASTPLAPDCDGVGQIYAVKVWWTDKLGIGRSFTTARPTS